MSKSQKTTKIMTIESKGTDRIFSVIHYYRNAIAIFLLTLLATFPYKKWVEIESYPKAGQVSSETIIAPFTFDIVKTDSELKVERSSAEAKVSLIFIKKKEMAKKTNSLLTNIYNSILKLSDTTLSEDDSKKIRNDLQVYLSPNELKLFLDNPEVLKLYKAYIKNNMVKGILSRTVVSSYSKLDSLKSEFGNSFQFLISSAPLIHVVSEEDSVNFNVDSLKSVPQLFKGAISYIKSQSGSKNFKEYYSALFTLTKSTIFPTLIYDGAATSQKRKEAISSIKTVKRTVLKDVEIVRKHQIVNSDIEVSLNTLEKRRSETNRAGLRILLIFNTIDSVLLVIGVAILLAFYLMIFKPIFIDKRKYLESITTMVAVEFLVIRLGLLFLQYTYNGNEFIANSLQYSAIPMTVATLLGSILFNKNTGFMLSVFFSMYIGVVTDFDLIASIGTLITGGTAAYIADNVRYRKDFLRLVVWMVIVNSLAVLMAVIAVNEMDLSNFGHALLFAVSDAVISVLLVNLLLPIFESLFDLSTDMTLMELADMNHPLLKRLSIEAPGTYNHSILVANLAESAADSIGADPLQCRVASYYHDIGKLKKPMHFIENQRFKKNIHDKTTPAMSVRMISSHVKEGYELAKKYKLPKSIIDGITQHHGDSLVGYFYTKAMEQKGENETIDIRDFSYPGPKPQTNETAIIMIADTVEAISRTMKSVRTGDLRAMVQKVIRGKINNGQLDECRLTFNEVNNIVNGFMPILEGVFHSRIEYGPQEENDNE